MELYQIVLPFYRFIVMAENQDEAREKAIRLIEKKYSTESDIYKWLVDKIIEEPALVIEDESFMCPA